VIAVVGVITAAVSVATLVVRLRHRSVAVAMARAGVGSETDRQQPGGENQTAMTNAHGVLLGNKGPLESPPVSDYTSAILKIV